MRSDEKNTVSWHALGLSETLRALETTGGGLSEEEAALRLKFHGPNQLPRKTIPSFWTVYLRQFKSPLIYILGIAALISLGIGEGVDAAFIAFVLGLNATVGGIQEWRAEKSASALQKLLQIHAMVERDGELKEIDAEGVAPGDILWLESGNRVPADIRLIQSQGLELDESLLTGESIPVHKDPAWVGGEATPLADRRNMVYAGSLVARGRSKGIAVATGVKTAVGQLAVAVLGTPEGKPPLLLRMERLSRVVATVVLTASIVVALIGIFARGHSVSDMFLFAVALAVSAIPEGLPVALTIALAIGTHRMARRGVIVRRLAAVEGLGSCTMIASDKTGTLTCNELTAREIRLKTGEKVEVTGQGYAPHGQLLLENKPAVPGVHRALDEFVQCAVLCNEGEMYHRKGDWVWHGDPTDIALLSLGRKLGIGREALVESLPEIGRIPFEPEHRFSASFHRVDGVEQVFVKGAPERILAMCKEEAGLSSGDIHSAIKSMAEQGYRVLALAKGMVTERIDLTKVPLAPSGLTFLGLVGMIDPLRAGVAEAVETCHKAGITVSMVTGDHPTTALTIARELHLADSQEQVVTGSELLNKSAQEMREMVVKGRVFARIEPRQKLELVKAMQEAGHFVAVTGDGVNDAPALRVANIGVSMGKSGTDIAREASELVLSDDNFATIVAGVEEGRVAYDNIRKLVFLLASTGAAEVLMVGLAMAMGFPLPLLPVQLLWLNLVTNGIQDVALAFEPNEGGVLNRKPRPPTESLFNRLMIERSVLSAVWIGGVGFGLFAWLVRAGWTEDAARNALLLLFVLFENFHIGNCRSETKSAFKMSPLGNPILLIGTAAALGLHILMMYLPFGQRVLRAQPVDLKMWAILVGLAFSVVVVMELHKWTWKSR